MESTADGELISPSLIDLPRSSDSIDDFVRIGTPTQDSLVELELNLSSVDDINGDPSVISKEPSRVTTPRLSEHFDFEYIHPIDWANPGDLANLENSSQVQPVENVGQSATQTNINTNDAAPSTEPNTSIEATRTQDSPTEEEPLPIKIFHGEPGLFFAMPKRQGSVIVLEADADMPLPSAESLISTLSDTLIGGTMNGDTETLQTGNSDQAQQLEPIKVLFQSLATKIQTRHALSTLFWIILPSLAVVYAAVLAQTPSVATPSASSGLQPPPVISIPLELQTLADLPIHSTATHADSKDSSRPQTDLPASVNEPSAPQSAKLPSENTATVVKSLSVITSTSSRLSLLSKAPANPTSAIPPRPSQTCSAHRLAASTTTTMIVAQTKQLRVAQPPYHDFLASLLQNMTDNNGSGSNSQCITSNTSIQIPALRGRFTYRCGSPRGFCHHPTVFVQRQSRQQLSSPSLPPLLLSNAPATNTSMRKTRPMKHQHNCHLLRQRKQQQHQQQKHISPPPTFLIDGTYPSTQSKSTTTSSALLTFTHLYNSRSLTDATNWCLTHVRSWVRWVLGGAKAHQKAQEWMRKVKHNMANVKESIALGVAQVEAWAEEELDALQQLYAFVRREARDLAKGWVVKAERQMVVAGDLMVRAVGEMIAVLPWVG